jgi:hypothetical protein
MEEKRAGGGDARSGAATEEIGRARRLASPCRYLAAAASAAEGFGVGGFHWLRGSEPRKPSRRGEQGVVGYSGPIGEPEWARPSF